MELHRVVGAAGGEVAQGGGIAEHLHQRDEGVQLLRAFTETTHGLDATTALVDVARHIADVVVGRVDLDLHHRFKQHRAGFHEGLLEAHLGAELEGHVAGVDGV